VASEFTFLTFVVSAVAGGIAGTSIDLALFPVDSIKTRLQASTAKVNFVKDAEQVSKFRGLAASMAAAFPCAAAFWLFYEFGKYQLRR
jgi:solute carrier family 25 S-adenosylmethionine transporter 26